MRKNISSKNVSKNETTKTPKTLKLSKTVLEEKAALKKAKTPKTGKKRVGSLAAFVRELLTSKATKGLSPEKLWKMVEKKFPDRKHNGAGIIRFYNCPSKLARKAS